MQMTNYVLNCQKLGNSLDIVSNHRGNTLSLHRTALRLLIRLKSTKVNLTPAT